MLNARPFLLHALSPLHAGTGQAIDIIDLPIARMRSTGIPLVPGSSIKGVLRDSKEDDDQRTVATFGPDTNNAAEHSGALVVSDAKLLALPVRSFFGTFAWVTSPLLLTLASRDLKETMTLPALPSLDKLQAIVTQDSKNLQGPKVYLEDLDVNARSNELADQWAKVLAKLVVPEQPQAFTSRFIILDDELMSFLWETATQVDTRIRLNPETRTVAKGALWMEESLPPETLLVGLLGAHSSRKKGVEMSADEILNFALGQEQILQFGGKATVGRGRCRVIPMQGA